MPPTAGRPSTRTSGRVSSSSCEFSSQGSIFWRVTVAVVECLFPTYFLEVFTTFYVVLTSKCCNRDVVCTEWNVDLQADALEDRLRPFASLLRPGILAVQLPGGSLTCLSFKAQRELLRNSPGEHMRGFYCSFVSSSPSPCSSYRNFCFFFRSRRTAWVIVARGAGRGLPYVYPR